MDPHGDSQTYAEPAQIVVDDGLIRVMAWPLMREHGPQQVRRLLRPQVIEYLHGQALEDAEVVVSELATNAFVHTDGACEMRIVRHAGFPIACEIVDAGGQGDLIAKRLAEAATPIMPTAMAADPDGVAYLDEGGFGLTIVASLTKGQCGVHPTRLSHSGQLGKGVWFAVPALFGAHRETPRPLLELIRFPPNIKGHPHG
ncbi:ATP-binding protein [Planotetraspora sp. GP83]|uniref:ATP-binding protein n=1 Tax=Planotetraspora sp. GP83 TaxID=3156264 RepID=UPI003517E2EA